MGGPHWVFVERKIDWIFPSCQRLVIHSLLALCGWQLDDWQNSSQVRRLHLKLCSMTLKTDTKIARHLPPLKDYSILRAWYFEG